jgi:DNA-binding MarR family transcriptional regulator
MAQAPGAVGEREESASWQNRFAEQVATASDLGMPRSVVRVLAWLVVCDPPHQSAEDLQSALRLSAGSVSGAVTTLVRSGVVARRSFPGERRTYYEIRPDGWQRLLQSRIGLLGEMQGAAERAIKAAEATVRPPDARLLTMYRFYAGCGAQLSHLLRDDLAAPDEPATPGPAGARRKAGPTKPAAAQPGRKRGKKGAKRPSGDRRPT